VETPNTGRHRGTNMGGGSSEEQKVGEVWFTIPKGEALKGGIKVGRHVPEEDEEARRHIFKIWGESASGGE